jgi:hypothetical protein
MDHLLKFKLCQRRLVLGLMDHLEDWGIYTAIRMDSLALTVVH